MSIPNQTLAPNTKPVKAINITTGETKIFNSAKEAAAFAGTNTSSVSRCAHNLQKQTKGWTFEFINDHHIIPTEQFEIYKIENLLTGKVYIGVTNNSRRRWMEHKSIAFSKRPEAAYPLYVDMRVLGIENFEMTVLHVDNGSGVDKFALENDYIREYGRVTELYNKTSIIPAPKTIIEEKRYTPHSRKIKGTNTATGEVIEFNSLNDAGRATGITAQNIGKCAKGERSHAGGYKWEYID